MARILFTIFVIIVAIQSINAAPTAQVSIDITRLSSVAYPVPVPVVIPQSDIVAIENSLISQMATVTTAAGGNIATSSNPLSNPIINGKFTGTGTVIGY